MKIKSNIPVSNNTQLIVGIDLIDNTKVIDGSTMAKIKSILLKSLSKYIVGNGNYEEAISLKTIVCRNEFGDIDEEIDLE